MKTAPTTEYAGYMTFHGDAEPSLTHFGPNPWGVQQYGHDGVVKPIFEVIVREPNGDEEPGYWSWWDHVDQRFTFTWRKEFLLEMCFTYGTDTEAERGAGKKVQTVVEIVRKVLPDEVTTICKRVSDAREAREPERRARQAVLHEAWRKADEELKSKWRREAPEDGWESIRGR